MTAESAVFALSGRAVDGIAAADPCLALILGLPDAPATLTDYSPGGVEQRTELHGALLREVRALESQSGPDRVAKEVMEFQLATWLEAAEAGDYLRDVNILSSPPQQVRMALELQPPHAGEDRIAALLAAVPAALRGWRESLQVGAASGLAAARRQALVVAGQLRSYADSWLRAYAAGRGSSRGLTAATDAAAHAFADAALWLADVYCAVATDADAVGEERYRRAARAFNGVDLDLDDTFAWGWQELTRLTAELRGEVDRLYPGLPLGDVRDRLVADSRYQIHGVPALTAHLEELTATATERVDGHYFDIDPRVRQCAVRIAAEGAAAAPYYVPPSEDLSRPGSTWYPTRGADVFPRWWLESVWFHEAVPGHHLQLGAVAAQDRMSRFQRVLGMTSGHAEGWALYAERLADELGWFADPGTRIGFLSAQLMRAVRVVVDIGLHTGRRVPPGFANANGPVTPALAERMLIETALLEPGFAASEVDRYLGLPGQAISYKVGERVWLAARDDAQAKLGAAFDLKDWHMAGIRLGPMGLAQFAREMSAYGH